MFTACSAASKWTKNKSGLTDYNVTQPQKNARVVPTDLFNCQFHSCSLLLLCNQFRHVLCMFVILGNEGISTVDERDIKKILIDNVRAAESTLL